jgi:hypothetical protein
MSHSTYANFCAQVRNSYIRTSKGTVVRVYATVTYKVSGGRPSFILNLSTRWLNDYIHGPATLALGQSPVTR